MKRKLRTIAKNLKTKERVLVTLLFAFVLSCMSIGYAYYQTELNLEANIRLLKGDLEITSASVYKTKNSSLVGEIAI
jgi:cell division protein FtsL